MSAENFGLTDPEFWTDPLRREEGPIPPEGLYLGAPNEVVLQARQTLPIVARRSVALRQSIAVPFKKHALLHAVDLERNVAYCATAVDQEGAIYEEPDAAFLAGVALGKTLQPLRMDARERLDLPWRPSRLLFTLFLRERASNRRLVVLGAGPAGYTDPAVEQYVESKKTAVPPPLPSPTPGNPLPAYVPVDGSPKAPDKRGIVASCDRVTELAPEARCVLRVAARVPVDKQDLVPANAGRSEKAVVAFHLLLVGADSAFPIQRTLQVPIAGEVKVGQDAVAFFAVDLLSLVTLPNRTETYFLSIFSRDAMVGPQPVAFVGKDRL